MFLFSTAAVVAAVADRMALRERERQPLPCHSVFLTPSSTVVSKYHNSLSITTAAADVATR